MKLSAIDPGRPSAARDSIVLPDIDRLRDLAVHREAVRHGGKGEVSKPQPDIGDTSRDAIGSIHVAGGDD
jgi:hypothetical protein